jgi:hypothetical protein
LLQLLWLPLALQRRLLLLRLAHLLLLLLVRLAPLLPLLVLLLRRLLPSLLLPRRRGPLGMCRHRARVCNSGPTAAAVQGDHHKIRV